MPVDRGLRKANDFLAEQAPVGLPIKDAIKRIEHADARCHTLDGDQDRIDCTYVIMGQPIDGVLGEDQWTVHLQAKADGTLESATIERSHAGIGGTSLN